MKERPILMSAPMVSAILADRKTQTRRIVSPQPSKDCSIAMMDTWHSDVDSLDPEGLKFTPGLNAAGLWDWWPDDPIYCRYGRRGDQLWVKETFFPACKVKHEPKFAAVISDFIYRADYADREPARSVIAPHHWKPSIFMPRLASRIHLSITNIRVERLNDINEEDAKAEGCPAMVNAANTQTPIAIMWYEDLWEKINGAGSWVRNPWVWVIDFKKKEPA